MEAHPESVAELVYQYRMNDDIMLLANKLIYGDRLRCGSMDVSESALVLPRHHALKDWCKSDCKTEKCWISKLLDERWVNLLFKESILIHITSVAEPSSLIQMGCPLSNQVLVISSRMKWRLL